MASTRLSDMPFTNVRGPWVHIKAQIFEPSCSGSRNYFVNFLKAIFHRYRIKEYKYGILKDSVWRPHDVK